MRKLLFPALLLLLTACSGAPQTACPDPDPDPTGPCASSHSRTYGG